MRKIIVTEFVSLDGVMEEPAWSLPYWNEEISKFKDDETRACDAMLLGRVTYQGFAAVWPHRTAEEGAGWMNATPKYVVSNTLKEVAWSNSTLLTGDVAGEISRLKQMPGKDILVYGSSVLVHWLMRHDLVDTFHLLVYPVVVGKGKRAFKEDSSATLKLVEARPVGSGVVLLRYQPDRK